MLTYCVQCFIKAGLFSAVSSAFIVTLKPELEANPSDITNSLLMTIIELTKNRTNITSPVDSVSEWSGPTHIQILVHSLGYASLSLSLLSAFGAVLAKQWLGHFKSSHLGQGGLEE